MIVEFSYAVALIAVGFSAACTWLVWTAARISIDDYGTLCFGYVSKLSVVAKLAFLCGLQVPQLERARFAFFPAARTKPDGSEHSNDDCVETGMEGGLDRDAMLQFLQRNSGSIAKSLVVAFSGGATNKVGVPRLELRRTLRGTSPTLRACDQLFVLDPTGMSFYAHNFESSGSGDDEADLFAGTLQQVFRFYRRVVLVGNCMGATGALRCAALLPRDDGARQGRTSCSGTVLAFNPEIEPASDARWDMRTAARLAPSVCRTLRLELARAVEASAGRVHVHCSAWPPELQQARCLECEAEVGVQDSRDLVALRAAVESAGSRVVRFVHSGVTWHGMVSNPLRGSGALGTLLDEAVQCT